MKKLIYLIVAIVILGLITSGCIPVVPTIGEKGNGNGNGNGNGIDLTGYHYNLNLIGKKANWPGGGNYEGNRHTMFVPEDTSGETFTVGTEGTFDPLDGIKILMTQGDEFSVVDGNWFDDGKCGFQLGSGTYRVFIVAKAKPGPDPDGYYSDITGWVYCQAFDEYLFDIGKIKVSKKLSKKFEEITDLFYVSKTENPFQDVMPVGNGLGMWVFTYLKSLEGLEDYQNAEYFWQYENHGNKLVKVRFYPD